MKYKKPKGRDFCRGEHKIKEIERVIRVYKELKGFGKQLAKFDVLSCNVGLTEKQEKRVKLLKIAANDLAEEIGLKAYHQGDPRGCSLYLIDKTMDDSNYSRGIAIY